MVKNLSNSHNGMKPFQLDIGLVQSYLTRVVREKVLG